MGHSSLGEELNGCKAVSLLGQMIVQVNCMVKGKGPEFNGYLLWPVQDDMNQHDKTPCCDGLDGMLSHPILVMNIDATK
eukprot:13115250-Ditylum_brightwellii.AAC.1